MKRFFLVLVFLQISFLRAEGEKVPFALLRRLLPSNPVIVEAGAQFGEDTRWMSEMWPNGIIHSFEPSPESFAELKKVAEVRSNVKIYPLALSDRQGEFPFYLAGGASSLLRPEANINKLYFHADLERPIYVKSTTLDQWCREIGASKVDFLWLDMEGNELRALEAGLETLKKVTCVYTEVNLQQFWEGCVQYGTLQAWFKKHGFEEIWSDIVPNWHGNALFINTSK